MLCTAAFVMLGYVTMAVSNNKHMFSNTSSLQIPQYTFSRLKGKTNNGGGSGWSLAGKQFFDSLQGVVKADREKHSTSAQTGEGMTFNKELYQCYQQRRDSERDRSLCGSQDKQSNKKPPAYQCFDEFDDESDEDKEHQNSAAINLDNITTTAYEEM